MATMLAVSRSVLRQGPQWVWVQETQLEVPGNKGLVEKGGRKIWRREDEWKEDGNSICFSASAAERSWTRVWICTV